MDTVNIDFIAKKAGCSPATVSRVLNKSKRVSSELEQRVYDVIENTIIIRMRWPEGWQRNGAG